MLASLNSDEPFKFERYLLNWGFTEKEVAFLEFKFNESLSLAQRKKELG